MQVSKDEILHIANLAHLTLEENEVDADMREIFDTGYAYLYNFVEELKIILENYYQNDFEYPDNNEIEY